MPHGNIQLKMIVCGRAGHDCSGPTQSKAMKTDRPTSAHVVLYNDTTIILDHDCTVCLRIHDAYVYTMSTHT